MKECRRSSPSSIEMALHIMELVAKSDELLTHAMLSRMTGQSPGKTLGMLNLLTDRGFLEQDKEHGAYMIGVRGIQLSQSIIGNLSIVKYARPVMESLEKVHEEAIYVAILKDSEVVFVDMVDTEQTIKATSLIGQSFPFFSNAAGKVIMAFEPREYLQRQMGRFGRKCTRMDMEDIQSELSSIRNRGVAYEVGGLGDNVASVAVAIKDYAGKVLGALTMIAPSFRLLGERLDQEIIPSMIDNAGLISSRFGYSAV